MLSRLRYNSPVNTISSTYNATIGYDDTSGNNIIGNNVIVSQRNNLYYPTDFPDAANTAGFHRMVAWKSYILDYSEYVDLNPDTEVTLTFFSHSNVDANALQNAYAYYGIECLGGGIPTDFSFNIPDTSISCSSPGTQSCVELPLPFPTYRNQMGYLIGHNWASYLFDNVQVYKVVGGVASTIPYPVTFTNNYTTLKICLDQQDAPFQDFRIVYRTFHKTVIDDFRIYLGFYNNIEDCTEGDVIDATLHPNLTNGDILLCGADNLPTLNLTGTCIPITIPHTFQWYRQNNNNLSQFDIITGATNAVLQLAYDSSAIWNQSLLNLTNNYNPYICNTYVRKVLYKEPFCNNPKAKVSEEFHIYNRWAIKLKFSNATDNDICFGDTYNLSVSSPSLSANTFQYTYGCALPSHFNVDFAGVTNQLAFQLFDPATNQPFGNIINYTFTGPFLDNTSIPGLNLSFSFNNINPATGNTPLFIPTSSNTSFPISIMVSGTYLGCTINGLTHTSHIQDINFSQSAVGGQIAYNCATNSSIISQNDGVTYGGYAWEYSTSANFTIISVVTGATSSTLSASIIATLPYPVYIRRRSNGTGECLLPKYSNVVFLSSHPSSVIFNTSSYPSSICQGSTAPILNAASSNGILGTWNIATASNQISQTYIFTPLEGYCLPPYTYSLTVLNFVLPTFIQIGPFCAGTSFTLPSTSNNATPIAGTWFPAVDLLQTRTYTFTPNGGSNTCNSNITMTVVINPVSTVSFANSNSLFSPICFGSPVPTLPNVDDNGVAGTWVPAVVTSDISHNYTFTPTNTCIPPATFTIGVIPQCGFTISWGSEVSCQSADPRVKFDENIADGPCLRVCEYSHVTYELHGNLSLINHTDWNITGGTLLSATNSTCEIEWNNSTFCALQGVIYLNNGTQLFINKCIEKLEAPHAAFGVFPLPPGELYSTCVDTPTYFENFSFADNGDDNLYYNWYFSDGTTSNEFEPVHTFNAPGVYTVTLVVSNGCSCVGQVTGVISVEEGQIKINCPSVVCEGNVTRYTIDPSFGTCSDLNWQVDGGAIVSQQNNNTEIGVIWNAVGADGFGYLSVSASSCSNCISKVRVPVVKQLGTIIGDIEVCEKTQNLYSLPQWPTTNFNWTLNDHGTGAILILNTQRNEIIVQSSNPGILDLYCTYNNTLLNCGGTAHLTITVNSSANVDGNTIVCQNSANTYNVLDNSGNMISNPSWTVTGPNLFEQTGTSNPFTVAFPAAGIYYITSTDPTHCSLNPLEVTVLAIPASPNIITGPSVVCPGTPVTYSCNPPSGVIAHWSVNASSGTIIGSSTGNSILVNFNPLATTPFVVNLWYEKEACLSNTISITVTRDVPNLAVIDSDLLVCGSSYGDYAINNVQADSYIWSIQPASAGSIESGQNSSSVHILWNQQAQIAQVNLEVRKCGRIYPFTTPINVTIINAPVITITGDNTICSLQNASFSFSQAPVGTFSNVNWDFGDGSTASSTTLTSTTHQYQTPTDGSVNYTVTATVSGGNGCLMNATDTFDVTVSPSPVVAISPVNGLNLCGLNINPASYTYTVTMQGGFAATDQIIWYRNNVPVQSGSGVAASTINVQSFGVGVYYASVTNSFNCTSSTQIFQVIHDCGGCTAPEVVDIAVNNNGCDGIIAYPTLLPAGYTSANWQVSLPGATIISSATSYFEAENIPPGEYPIRLNAFYDYGGQNCHTFKELSFIIPYKADLKYQVSCGTGNTYQVTLLDFSTYYAQTPATQYWFSVDNGSNWYLGTTVSGIYQFSANLSPGNYQLGIRIYRPGYTACEKFIPLNLPNLPSASFTSTNNICKDSAVQFTVTNPQPGNQYLWNFNNEATNLQQNPVKTFTSGGPKQITLTVSNQYGCSVTFIRVVTIINSNMAGTIQVTPATVCQGGQMTLHYNPTPGTITPTQYAWYQNSVTATPFASTSLPNSNLAVTQNGQYLVYLQDSNGCRLYTTQAATVAFTPLPQTPVITGNSIACVDSPITLKVPVNNSVIYEWYRDGVLQSLWNNSNTITDTQSIPGIHIYSVIAKILAGGTTYCNSAAGTLAVNVVALPDMPVLSLSVLTCDPYQVAIEVTNPQTDVGYYWSNGDTGANTIMTHDGPLQVRAVINECVVKTQLDLPMDLEPLSWIFPKGCYQACDKPTGYIIGPLGEFEKWYWLANNTPISSGSGSMSPLVDLDANTDYSMELDNGYCTLVTGSMSIESIVCSECGYGVEVGEINCIRTNNQTMYQVVLHINNPGTTSAWATFSAPNGEGFFTPVTVNLQPGNWTYTVLFTGQAGFNGGLVSTIITSQTSDNTCSQKIDISFPENCESIEECRFNYKLKTLNCVKTNDGNLYHIAFEITNPYAINATSALSIPAIFGTITPSSVTAPNGVTVQHFYFYPVSGFGGGVVPLTITSSIGSVICTKTFDIKMPEYCPEVKQCEFVFSRRAITCGLMPNGQYAYTITTTINNPYGTAASIGLSAPNGEGYFVPSVLNLPLGSSVQTFVFYPTNGFLGGTVSVVGEGHYKDDICLTDLVFTFKRLCCPTCRTVDLNDPQVTAANLLVLAPNPAGDSSTIFYNFVTTTGIKVIVLTDLLGRTLQEWQPSESKGTITVDCSRYAQGHYLILMKQNNTLIESTRMIKN